MLPGDAVVFEWHVPDRRRAARVSVVEVAPSELGWQRIARGFATPYDSATAHPGHAIFTCTRAGTVYLGVHDADKDAFTAVVSVIVVPRPRMVDVVFDAPSATCSEPQLTLTTNDTLVLKRLVHMPRSLGLCAKREKRG